MTEYLNYWLKEEKVMNKDKVTQIMDEWYTAMGKNGISVQPKASTILGTILAKHMTQKRDIWAEALEITGGEFASWYGALSKDEKLEYEEGRRNASKTHDPRELLKG